MINKLICYIQKRRNTIDFWRKKGLKIGKNCEVYNTVNFGSEPFLITIGDRVRINHNVQLITHDGGVWVLRNLRDDLRDIDLFGKIEIGNNVHIGTNSIIMPNVKIGNNVIIGCGAIVTKNIPDNCVAVGVPAKVIESIDDYCMKHIGDFVYTKSLSTNEKKKYM